MREDALARMSAGELDEYARALGIEVGHERTAEGKARILRARRGRSVVVRVLGLDFEIPIKRAHDKRVTDLLGRIRTDDAAAERAMGLLLGEDQMAELVGACTDDDGTVDVEAMGLALAKLVSCRELKNF